MILPNEIWLHVAQFISKEILIDLYAVNKLFMDLALSEKYADIQIGSLFSQYDPYTACRYLDHISQAHISPRIRHLTATLSFELFEQNPYQNRHLTRFLPGISLRGLTSKQQDSLRQRQDILQNIRLAVFKFLKTLPSIDHLEVHYDHSLYPRALSSVFVSFLWRRFGPKLRKLTVHSSLGGIAGLLSSSTDLGALTEIHLDVDNADCTQLYTPDTLLFEIDTRIVVRFCNTMSTSLRSLTVAASPVTGLRMPLLFQELSHFPELESLALNIPSPRDEEDGDFSGLILSNCSRLKNLSLPVHPTPAQTYAMTHNLRSLTIAPSQHTSGQPIPTSTQVKERRLNTLRTYITASNTSLGSLCLDDAILHFPDLNQILHSLPSPSTSNLRHLRVKVVAIHPQLFMALHKRLPLLSSLDITARTAQHEYTEDGCYHCDIRRLSENDVQEPLQIFNRSMSSAGLDKWPLYSLSVVLEKCPIVGLEKSWRSMMKTHVPNLEHVEFDISPPPAVAPLAYNSFN